MLPHERALVEQLKDEPFALIGINSDGKADKVFKMLEEQDIAWRNAIDDSTMTVHHHDPIAITVKCDTQVSIFFQHGFTNFSH